MIDYKNIDPMAGMTFEEKRLERKREKRARRVQSIDDFFNSAIFDVLALLSFFVGGWVLLAVFA